MGPDGRVRALGRSGTATVTATRGEVRCEAEVRTVAEVAAPDVHVALVETDTLRPVAGATVVVAVEGMPHRQAVSAEDGTARFDDIEAEVFDLHVFAPVPEDGSPGRAYVSVIGTHTRNLLLEVPPDELPDHLGGIQGEVTMEALHGDSAADSGVALSGLSVPELDGRLPERLLAGYEVEANATCDHESKTVPIGSEWSIVHSGTLQKSAFVALGRPGPRIAWALGRQDTVFLGSTVCGQSNVIGNLLEWYAYDLFPEYPFPRLSSVGPRVEVGLADADRLGHAPDLTDTLAFPVVRPEFSAQRMVSLTLAGDDGALPSLMVGGTFVPQLGLVPLGLAAPSPFQEAPLLRLAPLHGGLEGGGYVLLYLARDGSYGWSARLIHRDHLVAGERIEVPPLLPQPSRYRPSDETDRALIVRAPDAGTAFRAVLTDRDGRMWSVQHARREQILLPYPAQFTCGQGPCGDRFGFERAEAFVLDAPLDALVRRGGLHAGDLLGQVRAFSTSR